MSIEERVAKLERQNRWMKRTGAVLLATAAFVVLAAQGKDTALPDLFVRSLTVKPGTGDARISLAFADGVPGLVFTDENGKMRMALTLLPGKDGGRPNLILFDKDRSERAILGINDEGVPHLSIFAPARKKALSVLLLDDEPVIAMWDAKGNLIWNAPK